MITRVKQYFLKKLFRENALNKKIEKQKALHLCLNPSNLRSMSRTQSGLINLFLKFILHLNKKIKKLQKQVLQKIPFPRPNCFDKK
jgi:hypothetical protein